MRLESGSAVANAHAFLALRNPTVVGIQRLLDDALFSTSLAVIDLVPDGGDRLQEFFEANPFYFLAVHGQSAQPREAHEEIAEDPPSGWPFTRKYVFGYQRPDGQLAA
ncbi:MAG: hypothetical protein ACK5QX_08000, partial [bacterium]